MSLATDMSDGIGGLSFVAQAPPGIGRLIRIPFYSETATANFDAIPAAQAPAVTAGGGTASLVTSLIWAGSINAFVTGTAILTTPQISWATLRIVGFEVAIASPAVSGNVTGAANTPGGTALCFSDLQIGGGANLFVHEDFAPAGIYLAGQDSFSGLRDYPILKSPNTARVSVQLAQSVAASAVIPATAVPRDWIMSKFFSCNLVCEILQDDNYGSHIPGPYARKGAMVRRGGSFV